MSINDVITAAEGGGNKGEKNTNIFEFFLLLVESKRNFHYIMWLFKILTMKHFLTNFYY